MVKKIYVKLCVETGIFIGIYRHLKKEMLTMREVRQEVLNDESLFV